VDVGIICTNVEALFCFFLNVSLNIALNLNVLQAMFIVFTVNVDCFRELFDGILLYSVRIAYKYSRFRDKSLTCNKFTLFQTHRMLHSQYLTTQMNVLQTFANF
jgi:hypothetical protein